MEITCSSFLGYCYLGGALNPAKLVCEPSRNVPNDEWYIKMIHFSQNDRIRNNNDMKKWKFFFSRWFDGLDTGSKDEEYGKFMYIFNWKLLVFVIMIPTRIRCIRWIWIFLIILPYFLDLKKPGTDNLDPDYFPGSHQGNTHVIVPSIEHEFLISMRFWIWVLYWSPCRGHY